MAGSYGTRFKGAIGAADNAMGGAAQNLPIEALAGQGDMVCVYDDFNGVVAQETFAGITNWEMLGWDIADINNPTADTVGINSTEVGTNTFDSCIKINPGTKADAGGNMGLTRVGNITQASGEMNFPHIFVPSTLVDTEVLDNSVWVFACRIGLQTDEAEGDFDGKGFIGWAESGDASILTFTTGAIAQAENGPLVGFHIGGDGEVGVIDGISQRTVSTAYAEGTNFTRIIPIGGVDGNLANGAIAVGDIMWFDLALRMDITNMSDDAANGTTRFFSRRVVPMSSAPGAVDDPGPDQKQGGWVAHPTVLTNQTPNNNLALVPTIEFINGPADESDMWVDWWVFGTSRFSRR